MADDDDFYDDPGDEEGDEDGEEGDARRARHRSYHSVPERRLGCGDTDGERTESASRVIQCMCRDDN